MFETGYRGGYHGQWSHEVTPGESPNWEALKASKASFTPCMEFEHDGTEGTPQHIVMVEAGSYGGDILDDSNAWALTQQIEAWMDDDRIDYGPVDWHTGMGSYRYVCVNPETIDSELLEEMIQYREAFDDYGILDESDYSERELQAWNEGLDWEIRQADTDDEFTDEFKSQLAEWVSENYYGYSDPGYVKSEWVTEGIAALKDSLSLDDWIDDRESGI